MKKDEVESYIKSFLLFFLSIELLVGIIVYFYYKEQIAHHQENVFLEMKNFNYTLKGKVFSLDIVAKTAQTDSYRLLEKEGELYAYFPIPQVDDTLLKIAYPKAAYQHYLSEAKREYGIVFLLVTAGVALLSIGFARYTLGPLRRSLMLLEEFLKDIIHDLNTPVTAILLNSRMLRKKSTPERIERIELSANTIAALHKNLESFLRQTPLETMQVDITALVHERAGYYQSIYTDLEIRVDGEEVTRETSGDALQRILDNIISNACKYNRPDGYVHIAVNSASITIEDNGYGIKDTKRIFQRFYKEGERGLGIGLHIVAKLCKLLHLDIEVSSSSEGSRFELQWR